MGKKKRREVENSFSHRSDTWAWTVPSSWFASLSPTPSSPLGVPFVLQDAHILSVTVFCLPPLSCACPGFQLTPIQLPPPSSLQTRHIVLFLEWGGCHSLTWNLPPLGLYTKSPETPIQKNLCTPMFIAAQFTIAKYWKQPKCPSTNEWIKNYGTFTQWNSMQQRERRSFYPLQQHRWNWRALC